jgi:Cu/Ag efflux protein CusF
MNKKILMGIIPLAVSLLFTSRLMAQAEASTAVAVPAQKTRVELFNGVIKSVDMSKKDVVVQFQKDKMGFSLKDKTKVFEGTKELKLSDLKKGEWASVEYKKEGSQRIAESIHVSSFKKSEHVASTGNTTNKMMSTEKAPKTSLNW